MSILCHIALRIITKSCDPKTAITSTEAILEKLCNHSDIREVEDYFQRALMSAFMLRCLQKAEFFGRRMTEAADPYPHELEIGALILRLLQALQFNAHEIYETKLGVPHRISDSKVIYIGVGIYRTGALFNHECYPSVTRYFCGTSMVLNTIRPVEQNAIVAENYGPMFTRQSLEERQRNLKARYWFKCECKACTENWPMLKTMDHTARFK
jgi:SET and MYND domain-containing protein 4